MATSKKKPSKLSAKPTGRKSPSRTTGTAKKVRAKTASATSRARKRATPPKKAPPRTTPSKPAPPAKAKATTQLRVATDPPKTRHLSIKGLGGHSLDIVLDADCAGDARNEDVDRAIRSFTALEPAALADVDEHVFHYYLDCKRDLEAVGQECVEIGSARDVWKHVQFGFEATVGRREDDGKVYVSLECNCDWEPEHGLQLVFDEGRRVNKVGPFDGHLTNADAYDDPSLEEVTDRPRGRA